MQFRHRYHGIRYDDNKGSTGLFYLGINRLMQLLWEYFWLPRSNTDKKRPQWTLKKLDRRFSQGFLKFENSFRAFDRATRHFGRCVENIKRYREARQIEEFSKYTFALGDIPLYLDSMLFYLRIQADCLAIVIPYFYGQAGRTANIPWRSFRKQAKWFVGKRTDFDPKYTQILRSALGWFDTLAGKDRDEGLRNVVTHRLGIYQLSYTVPEEPNFTFQVSLFNHSGFVSDDVVQALKSMTADYFAYLDQTYAHFIERLRTELGKEFIPPDDMLARYYRFTNGPLRSFWVYPTLMRK